MKVHEGVHHRGCISLWTFFCDIANSLFDQKGDGRMRVNGKEYEKKTHITVAELLLDLGYRAELVAVEQNGEIVPRSRFAEIMVTEEDTLEVVSFVGGG